MYQFNIENQGTSTYLVYELEQNKVLDTTSLGMLTNNQIPGLAQTVFMQMNDAKYVKYNISGKISVEQVLTGIVNKKRLLGIFRGITDALMSAEDYMLELNSLLLDVKYIYSDVANYNTVMICVPTTVTDRAVPDFKGFFREIISHTQFDQSENGDYVAKLMNYLNRPSEFLLETFKELLESFDKKVTDQYEIKHAVISHVSNDAVPGKPHECQTAASSLHAQPTYNAMNSPLNERSKDAHSQTSNRIDVPKPKAVEHNECLPKDGESTGSADKISLFYLLQHYNKENAALYKSQQAMKKDVAGKKASKSKPKGKDSTKSAKNVYKPTFSVPGQQSASIEIMEDSEIEDRQERQVPIAASAMSKSVSANNVASANFGDTYFFNDLSEDDGDTVILGCENSAQAITPHLIRQSNNENIPLNKPIFRIGRDVEFNDYAITNNRYVGHSHCHIITRDNQYFIIDDNSKNHTLVNGSKIKSGEEVQLAHACSICVADEEFEFRLY